MTVPDNEWVTDEELARVAAYDPPVDPNLAALRKQASQYLNPSEPRNAQPRVQGLAGIAVKATDKYPWDKWIDGQYHTAELNKDFALSVSRFQVLLHRKAADLGIYCRTEKVKGVFPPTVGFLFMDDKMRLNNEWIRLAGLEVWKEDEEEPQN